MTRIRTLAAVLVLVGAVLACASPIPVQSVDQAATAVAQTLSAVSIATPAVQQQASPVASPAATQPAPPSPVTDLLPHSVYYLNNDKSGHLQVFRLARDGKTIQQITFEPAPVDTFDVSPVDGSVAYTSNNQLYLVDASGAGRRMLVDGGAVDSSAQFINSLGSPVWSPDGKTIAFSHNGLNFYAVATGGITPVLANEVDTTSGFPMARELYAPEGYSPDGTKLLVGIGFFEGGTFGILRLSDKTLVRLSRPDGSTVCCELRWVPDSSGLYVASRSIGFVDSGLGYANADTGEVSILLPGSAPDNTYNFAAGPQVGHDGKLYYFFNNLPQIPTASHTPLYVVRSETDAVTGRTQLKPDAYTTINEVLWAPDASLAIVAEAPVDDVNAGGVAELVYPDGRPDVTLTDFALSLHWGP